MNTPAIPKGWEKCTLLCATKVMLATSDNLFGFEILGSSIRLTSGSLIRIADMDWLGITPVRKVQPIEFTVHEAIGFSKACIDVDGWGYHMPTSLLGKTFREVIE